jgi:phosphatidylethanolamine-binding protein (PEBP) family uncharacterized protein
MMKPIYFCFLIFLMFSGCADDNIHDAADHSNAKQMTVTFSWPSDYGTCFDPRNPEIKIKDIPAGTEYFKVSAIDIQNNNFSHGGGTVYNRGTGKIGLGTLGEYYGPCPSQSPHGYGTYEFTVLACNSKDVVIGVGSHYKDFP